MKSIFTNTRIFLLLVAICILGACKSVSFQRYFPLEKDKIYTYHFEVDSTGKIGTDTLICRRATAKLHSLSDRKNLLLTDTVLITGTIGKIDIYYFEKPELDSLAVLYMLDKSFAGHLYCFRNRSLYVSWGWGKNMEFENDDFRILFPHKIKPGVEYKHKNGDYIKSFNFVGQESIEVNDRVYRDCIKLNVSETLGKSKRIATVWLAKGIGVVKWVKKNEDIPFIRP